MIKRKALGKGLGALIPKVTPEDQRGRIHQIDISQISPNPSQPRSIFDESALDELTASITEHGLLQPLVLRKYGTGYQIVIGERRWRAAQAAGLRTVPALLSESNDNAMLELALVENIQREDLNVLEEARAYQMMMDRFKLTQEQVAQKVGKNRSTVANTVRLLKLHDDVKKHILNSTIEMGHARAILSLNDPIAQRELCEETVKKGLTVRQVERKARDFSRSKKKPQEKKKDPFIQDAEDRLSTHLESKVKIKQSKRGGKIEILYTSERDLQRLFDLLTGD
jgi:ParB family chromosome partitioning protein